MSEPKYREPWWLRIVSFAVGLTIAAQLAFLGVVAFVVVVFAVSIAGALAR